MDLCWNCFEKKGTIECQKCGFDYCENCTKHEGCNKNEKKLETIIQKCDFAFCTACTQPENGQAKKYSCGTCGGACAWSCKC